MLMLHHSVSWKGREVVVQTGLSRRGHIKFRGIFGVFYQFQVDRKMVWFILWLMNRPLANKAQNTTVVVFFLLLFSKHISVW